MLIFTTKLLHIPYHCPNNLVITLKTQIKSLCISQYKKFFFRHIYTENHTTSAVNTLF